MVHGELMWLYEEVQVERDVRLPRRLTTAERAAMTSEEIVEHEMPDATPEVKATRAAMYRRLGEGR